MHRISYLSVCVCEIVPRCSVIYFYLMYFTIDHPLYIFYSIDLCVLDGPSIFHAEPNLVFYYTLDFSKSFKIFYRGEITVVLGRFRSLWVVLTAEVIYVIVNCSGYWSVYHTLFPLVKLSSYRDYAVFGVFSTALFCCLPLSDSLSTVLGPLFLDSQVCLEWIRTERKSVTPYFTY